ncbi:MAG: class I SAM-dependent RNA methyltransferase, partial [SAR324 cluster bacterium]
AVPELVVLDPPRRGLGGALVKGLLAVRPGWIVYVSCDGGSFSRDAARLAERYALTELRGYDLFPQTHHLELVGVFRRRA